MSFEVSSSVNDELVETSNEVEEPNPYLANPLPFHYFLREFISECNFIQYLSLLCSFPDLIPVFSYFTNHQVNLNDLDFSNCNMRSDRDIPLLFQLNQVFPNIKKVTLKTKNFKSNVNDILRAFANFRELEKFNIIFDSIQEKNILNVPFAKLKFATITFNSLTIKNLNKAAYLVENVLRYTTALTKIEFHNVVINNRSIKYLLSNDNLKTVKFTNCKLEKGPSNISRTLFFKDSIKHLIIREFADSFHIKFTQLLFSQMPKTRFLQNLKTIAFNVLDDDFIQYQNIKHCTELTNITLYFFDTITPTFITIFKDLIEILRSMEMPFKLTIAKISSENGTFNSDYEDFMEYIYNLDSYFFEVQNICYYK